MLVNGRSFVTLVGIAALCLVVMAQMLGCPITLWEPFTEAEDSSGSTFGWTLPTTSGSLQPRGTGAFRSELQHFINLPVLFMLLFRPPK
jgi:hypothetical protein